MTQKEIQERNKEIGLMLGWEENPLHGIWNKRDDISIYLVYSEHNNYPHKGLPFHRDWSFLMDAVDFIGEQRHKSFPILCVIGNTGCSIYVNQTNVYGDKFEGERELVNTMNINYNMFDEDKQFTKKEAVFIAISDFAKLYNEKKI